MANQVTYLTKEGYQKLSDELGYLKGPARQQLAARLRSAIQQGDLSENADYIQAKEDQGFLEGRIQELEYIMGHYALIEEVAKSTSEISIGSHVTIQEDSFEEETYHLVGPKEADPGKGRISYESPIGKALLGRKVGDQIDAEIPAGKISFKIIRIE
jgi:transcription elongation factor GreA